MLGNSPPPKKKPKESFVILRDLKIGGKIFINNETEEGEVDD